MFPWLRNASSALLAVLLFAASAAAAELTVCASGCAYTTIQAAVNAAVAGDVIKIRASETFTENITLPNKGALGTPITIRSDTADGNLPADGYRAKPADHAAFMPNIQAPANGLPALRTANGASDYILLGLEFLPNPGGFDVIVQIGSNSSTQQFVADEPKRITLDRLIVRGDPVDGQRVGVDLNGANLTIKNSHVDRIAAVGDDAIAIRCIQGSGPITIVNNYAEAAGENFICGGDDPQMRTNAEVVAGATTTQATLTNFRTGHTIATLANNQLIAILTTGGTKRRYTYVRSIDAGANTITYDAIPEAPDTGTGSDIRWGVIPNGLTIRRNYFAKPTAWMNPILATPTGVTATADTSAGALAAGTYYYRVVARQANGYANNSIYSSAATEVSATLSATGQITVSWTAVANASHYRVYGRAQGAPTGYLETTSTSLTDTGAALTSGSIPSASKWVVKNLFELKVGTNAQIDSNVLEYSWKGSDSGYGIWLKSNNQGGGAEFSITKDVVFEHNIIRHVPGLFNILGYNTDVGAASFPAPMENLTIRHNLGYDSNTTWMQGSGSVYAIKTSNTIKNLRIEHNTFIHHMRGFLYLTDAPVDGLVVKDNLGRAETYGVFGTTSCAQGTDCLNKNTVGSVWTFEGNAIAGASSSSYPANNVYPSVTDFETNHFENYGSGIDGNYALLETSTFNDTATDGTDRGADITAVLAATSGVIEGNPDGGTQTPFNGTPFAVPGTFEAEHFDNGGQDVAYHDNVPGNAGNVFRIDEDVDIIAAAGNATGYVINHFETGEWLEYTISVGTGGTYAIELHVSSEFTTSGFHLEVDGANVTGSVPVPSTGSWSTFQWVSVSGVNLSAGEHVLRVHTDQQYFNFDAIRITMENGAPTITTPLTATPNPAEVGEAVTFSVTASDPDGDPLTYTWDFGDGTAPVQGSSDSVQHTYTAVGTFSATVTVSDGTASEQDTEDVSVVCSSCGTQTPFNGTPFAVPGTFEAEHFDNGGQDVAYHDNVPGNAGNVFRIDEDVDIVAAAGNATGYVINNFETGEWLEYTISVGTGGTYAIELHVSSEFTTSGFHLKVDGANVGSVPVPSTGSWSTFQWVSVSGVNLSTGEHVLRVHTDQQYFDFDAIRFVRQNADPRAHWMLDETSGTTAADATGNGHTGTLTNGPTWNSAGALGGALSFDGLDDHVTIPSPSALLQPTDAYAISAWVKYTTTDLSGGEVASMGDSYLLRVLPTGDVRTGFFNGSTWTVVDTVGVNTKDGAWHHLVGQYTGTSLQVYVDGSLKQEGEASGPIVYGLGMNFYLGQNGQGSTNHHFAGTIDDVRVYDQPLTAAEIEALTLESPVSAFSHWKLDETSGTTAADSTLHQNHGTLANGPVWTSAGRIGGALTFDGVDDHVAVGSPSAVLKPTGAYAISAWVKYTTTDQSGGEVATMGDSYLLRVRPTGEVFTAFYDGSTWAILETIGVNTKDGAWHHLVGQYTGSKLEVYVDGVLEDEIIASGSIVYSLGTAFYLGQNGQGGTNHHFAGTIDHVRVYGRALSSSEIASLAAGQ